MRKLRPPSPAMAVALTALFVALGGTGTQRHNCSPLGSSHQRRNRTRKRPKPRGDSAADLALIRKYASKLRGPQGSQGLQGVQGPKRDQGPTRHRRRIRAHHPWPVSVSRQRRSSLFIESRAVEYDGHELCVLLSWSELPSARRDGNARRARRRAERHNPRDRGRRDRPVRWGDPGERLHRGRRFQRVFHWSRVHGPVQLTTNGTSIERLSIVS